jgi:voltage-gated potassium channel Kch
MARWQLQGGRGVLASAGNLVAVLVVYFALPVRTAPAGRLAFGLLVSGAAIAVVVYLLLQEVRALRVDANHDVGLIPLVLLLEVVVVAFALAYYVLAQQAGQMHGIRTRVDALYFTTATMTTVGYGDISAVGQLARTVVMVNLLFDLVFIAALTRLASRHLRHLRR